MCSVYINFDTIARSSSVISNKYIFPEGSSTTTALPARLMQKLVSGGTFTVACTFVTVPSWYRDPCVPKTHSYPSVSMTTSLRCPTVLRPVWRRICLSNE